MSCNNGTIAPVPQLFDMSDSLPKLAFGTITDYTLPDHIAAITPVADAVADCVTAMNSVMSAYQEEYDKCRAECILATGNCCECVTSLVESAADIASKATGNCRDKVMGQFGKMLGEIMELAGAAGCQLTFPGPTSVAPDPTQPPDGGPPEPTNPCNNIICPPGNVCVPTDPPVCIPLVGNCPPGQHWDQSTLTCVPDTPTCPPGQHWNPTQNRCVPDAGCTDPCCVVSHDTACIPPHPPPGGPCWPPVGTPAGCIEVSGVCGTHQPRPDIGPNAYDVAQCTNEDGQPCATVQTCEQFNPDQPPQPPAQTCCPSPQPNAPTVSPSAPSPTFSQPVEACSPEGTVALARYFDGLSDASGATSVQDISGTRGPLSSNAINRAFAGTDPGWISVGISKFLSMKASFDTYIADQYFNYIGFYSGCDNAQARVVATRYSWAKMVDEHTGCVPEGDLARLKMGMDYVCPWKIPSTGQLNNLLNGGWITTEQWRDAIRMNGDCFGWQDLLQKADNARPTIGDAVTLNLRDQISDDEYKEYLTKNSADPQEFGDTFKQLRQQWPNANEILDMAGSGTLDDDFAQKYNLDTGSDISQQEDVTAWNKAAGVSDDLFEKRWRAHWKLPQVGQILEWLNRLRPGRKKVNDPLPGVDFTEDDAKELLKYLGYPESTHDKILAMRYKPISFRHIAKSYVYGKMDDEDVIDAYKSMGYNDDVANALGNALIEDNTEKREVYKGRIPEKTVRMAFDNSVITNDKAMEFLIDLGVPFDTASERVQTWDTERGARETIELVKLIKRRFLRGDFSTSEAHTQLVRAGVEPERIDKLTAIWTQQREANTKIPAVAQLCGWFAQRLIDANTYITRLQNLGWKPDDAMLIASKCANDETMKELKAAIAAAEKAAKQAEQERKRKLKELKDAEPCRPRPKPQCGPVPVR